MNKTREQQTNEFKSGKQIDPRDESANEFAMAKAGDPSEADFEQGFDLAGIQDSKIRSQVQALVYGKNQQDRSAEDFIGT